VSISVSVSGANRSLRFDWTAASRAWAEEVTPAARSMMRAHAPFRTGFLRQHTEARTEASPGRIWVVLYTTAPYAPFILGGTRAHVIEARNARALRWVEHSGHGAVRFARRVQHPGTKPDNFPERAMKTVTPMILDRFAEAVKEAVIRG
jgi:hypothetical protein